MSTQNEDCSFYNVSAWGLQLVDDYELIKYIVERYSPNEIIIFGNLIDFVEGPSTQTNIDKAKDYLDDIFFNDIKLILDYGFPNNISTKREYLDRHFAPTELNEDLRYDEWGGVLLDVYGDDILKVRYDDCLTTSPQDCQYDALEKIAQYLYERNIKLYYVQTPVRKHYLSEEGAEDKMLRHCEKCRMIVEKNGGYYVNFLNFQKYTDEYFADCIHLNKDGAQMLTREFVKWYREIE